jgi:hypothetical protein
MTDARTVVHTMQERVHSATSLFQNTKKIPCVNKQNKMKKFSVLTNKQTETKNRE